MDALAKPMTCEEYLDLDGKASDLRHEFLNGIVVAMAGASPRHNVIAANIIRLLGSALESEPCRVFSSDQRVQVLETEAYVYPDVSVVCGQPRFAADTPPSLRNPTLVVEVLSTSTRDHDRGAKLAHYRRMPSIREVLLIETTETRIERYRRQPDDQWLITDVTGGNVQLESANAVLSLRSIYEKTDDLPED